ncbi:MAG: isopenicillin N synthase family oxygenase [Kofleriaceae bacterium]|nr:isopenicillin N synthase family oxygenase [Kofleriaceae bacterium]
MRGDAEFTSIPIVDVASLRAGDRAAAIAALDDACRHCGFFYLTGHGIDVTGLEARAREFFAQPVAAKLEIAMARGGRAWRGYFPLGGELTSGAPDWKEGIYFGAELADDDVRVRSGTPLHGRNLFPRTPAGLRSAVLAHIDACTQLGHVVMSALGAALGHPEDAFRTRYLADPLTLFRIFHYPAPPEQTWGVGEHTDYGLLTILAQDDCGGLEVRSRDGWVEAPPIPGAFVCNLGDMLERLSNGRYRSTPHRVRNQSGRDRLSMAFFFDPSFDAVVPTPADFVDDVVERWDGESVRAFEGTYGEYLVRKVSKVFPELHGEVLARD